MSPYDGMKLVAALRLLLRTARGRGGARHRAKPMPVLPEEAADAPPNATGLLDWHPRIQREPDPRQHSLPL
jgi:hypothetical protein